MALVRVYCGLAAADMASWLTAAVVDDSGRLLDVRNVSDDPSGYAALNALLADRSGGLGPVAVAADRETHLVIQLLATASRPIAVADDDATDDFAERFSDDESVEEMESSDPERRAVGLARALQAGTLPATAHAVPRDLETFKPVLAAHAAVATGRQAAAATLREILRELYPAALRAYPDPADPLPLAVLDALPEPGLLAGPAAGDRQKVAARTVAAKAGGVDTGKIDEAITALRVAIAESAPRRGVSPSLAPVTASTVHQAVAAVRACDEAARGLVDTLVERLGAASAPVLASRPRLTSVQEPPAGDRHTTAHPDHTTARPDHAVADRTGAARTDHSDAGQQGGEVSVGRIPSPRRRSPAAPPSTAPAARQPAASATPPATAPGRAAPPPQAGIRTAHSAAVGQPVAETALAPDTPASPRLDPRRPADPMAAPLYQSRASRHGRPHSPSDELTTEPQAGQNSRAGRINRSETGQPHDRRQAGRSGTEQDQDGGPSGKAVLASAHEAAAHLAELVEPEPWDESAFDSAEPDARAHQPDPPSPPEAAPRPRGKADPPEVTPWPRGEADPAAGSHLDPAQAHAEPVSPGRVTPPWLDNAMPPEPPTLRLVETPEQDDPAGDPLTGPFESDPFEGMRYEPPALRVIDGDRSGTRARRSTAERQPSANSAGHAPVTPASGPPVSSPPVGQEMDGDLLIFAQMRSAWFSNDVEEDEAAEPANWGTHADEGWRVAEQLARPAVGAETMAGLPRRVPRANLVPGSPLTPERPLQIVRDPRSIADHTSGYFRGWRRGQQVGGFAIGDRERGAWDFNRRQRGYDPDQESMDQRMHHR